jgi:nicotinamide-nucleotide amidase
MENFTLPGDQEFARLVQNLASLLVESGWTLSTAESCTGGWIAKCCTDLAGSSAWFDRGFVTYSNRSKHEQLGVEVSTLEKEGAVSESTAIEMAQGARQRAGVNAALAVTGIAGPDGGTTNKPVGLVWFAWSLEGRVASSEVMQFQGNRDAVRRQTVVHALSGLQELLSSAKGDRL